MIVSNDDANALKWNVHVAQAPFASGLVMRKREWFPLLDYFVSLLSLQAGARVLAGQVSHNDRSSLGQVPGQSQPRRRQPRLPTCPGFLWSVSRHDVPWHGERYW